MGDLFACVCAKLCPSGSRESPVSLPSYRRSTGIADMSYVPSFTGLPGVQIQVLMLCASTLSTETSITVAAKKAQAGSRAMNGYEHCAEDRLGRSRLLWKVTG